MAISTMDGLVSALASGQQLRFTKSSATSEGAGTWHSYWALAGYPSPGGTASAPQGKACTYTTTGAFTYTNPGSGTAYIGYTDAACTTQCTVILADRLWHNSTMSGTMTATYTFTAPIATFTRGASAGVGNEIWLEWYSAIGATGATLTIEFTNQNGSLSYATYNHPANAESVGQMMPVDMPADVTGVQSVSKYQWSATTGTAGNFGITVLRRLAQIPVLLANVAVAADFASLGMPTVENSSCLFLMAGQTGAVAGKLVGGINLVSG